MEVSLIKQASFQRTLLEALNELKVKYQFQLRQIWGAQSNRDSFCGSSVVKVKQPLVNRNQGDTAESGTFRNVPAYTRFRASMVMSHQPSRPQTSAHTDYVRMWLELIFPDAAEEKLPFSTK